MKDSKILKPEFHITDTQKTNLFELLPYQAKVAIDGEDIELTMPQHYYPLTSKVKKKIIDRCRSQYTTPRDQLGV